jgi:hypothetical protein
LHTLPQAGTLERFSAARYILNHQNADGGETFMPLTIEHSRRW